MSTATTTKTTSTTAAGGETGRATPLHFQDRGQGPPLLLLHGFTGAGQDWQHVFDLDALSRRFRLIIPDARGHGASPNPSGELSLRGCADDTFALLDRLGIGRFSAIGLSLGGQTLLHLATRQPDRVATMVTVSAASYFPSQARAIMVQQSDEGRSEAEWAEMRGRHRLGDEQIRSLWRGARQLAASYEDMSFTPPLLATIQARTLIVTGDRDPLYPLEIFVEQYRAIPRAALQVVPNGGHGPIFGEARAELVRTAVAFIDESSGSGQEARS